MDDVLPNELEVDELARRCQQETERYLANQPLDERYCLELLRRALLEHDQVAWQAIYTQYEKLVLGWVWKHPKFHSTEEEAHFFTNATFTRFWRALSNPEKFTKLEQMSQFLHYLKSCVHSAIEDIQRLQQRHSQNTTTWDDLSETLLDDTGSPPTVSQLAKVLEQLILDRLRGRAETIVATSSWVYGLKPRDIQAQHPDLFPNVQQVYRTKRNILDRLLRDPEIQDFRRQMR